MIDLGRLIDWFGARVPDGWFAASPRILADRDEIVVIGRLAADEEPNHSCRRAAEAFRESTRDQRIAIAREAELAFDRRVGWGVECHDVRVLFTGLSVPVMTRLRLPERAVLDTLVAAGVARSRSDALAWCVRLVSANQEAWLTQLRQALATVENLREGGPRPN